MNNIFNIKRFGHVFKKDLFENYKRYLLSFVTLMGIMVIILFIQTWDYFRSIREVNYSYINRELLTFMSILFFVAGVFFASTFMASMNSKLKRISYLVNPASNLEKYLTRWLVTTIGYILAFFIALWIADVIRVAACSIIFPDADIRFLDLSRLRYSGDDFRNGYDMLPWQVFDAMIFFYLFLQSLFLLGSTIWEKVSFIKTFTALSAIIFVYIMVCWWAILLSYGDLDGFGNVMRSFSQDTTDMQALRFFCIVLTPLTLANWTLAFFRIRESEIIKRI